MGAGWYLWRGRDLMAVVATKKCEQGASAAPRLVTPTPKRGQASWESIRPHPACAGGGRKAWGLARGSEGWALAAGRTAPT